MYVSIPLFIENFQNFFYNLYSFDLFILKLSNLRNILKIYQATIPEVGHHPLTEMHLNVLSYFKHYKFFIFFSVINLTNTFRLSICSYMYG